MAGRDTVHLAAAVVGNHERCGADLPGPFCIFGSEYPLNDKRPPPLLNESGSIVPSDCPIELTIHIFYEAHSTFAQGINPVDHIGQTEIGMKQEVE